VKLNDSSSGDGVGWFLTTVWSAGSLSAKSLAPDSRALSHKLYRYRRYAAADQTPKEQVDALTSGRIVNAGWVMGLLGAIWLQPKLKLNGLGRTGSLR
jgi:hypothetical protein